MRINLSKKEWQVTTLIFLSFIWGSSFILMKKGLRSYTYMQVAEFRIFFSFVAFLPFSIKHLKKLTKQNFVAILLVGVVGTAMPAFLFTKAQTQIDSSIAGILNSLTPMFTLIIGIVFYQSKARLINALGIFIGLLGAVLLVVENPFDFNLTGKISYYGIYVIIATICYGVNTNHVKYIIRGLSGLQITSLAFIVIGPIAGILLLLSDFSMAAASPTYLADLGYVALLAIFASVVALAIFNTLIQHSTAIFAASVTYIIPIFAVFWGLADGEIITPLQCIWILMILIGIYLVNKK